MIRGALLAGSALALAACAGHRDAPERPAGRTRGDALLARFLDRDATVFAGAEPQRAREAARRYADRLAPCLDVPQRPLARGECALRVILGDENLEPVALSTSPFENTVSSVLAGGRGSCAALVATVLALTENLGGPFQAVILRDHVLLASTSLPAVYYETFEGGRRLSEAELSRYRPDPPGGPIRAGGFAFLPYYLDNLAARFAETGEPESSERLFREALASAPGSARIHYNYGTFLLGLERVEEALVHLDRAIRLGWTDAAVHVNRGAALWRLGRLKAARRDFAQALWLDPTNREARANLRRLDDAIEAAQPVE